MPEYKVQFLDSARGGKIIEEVDRARQTYMERDKLMHEQRRRRLLRHQPYMTKAYQNKLGGEKAIKLPIMYRLVQTAVAAMIKKFPSVHAEALNASDRKAAEDMAKADSLLLQTVDNRSRTPFLYNGAFTLMGDGMVVVKTTPGVWAGMPVPEDDEEPKAYNERVQTFLAQNPLPFYTRIVDPLTFYPPLVEYGDAICIESAYRSTRQVMRELNLGLGGASGRELVVLPGGKPYPDLELPVSMPPAVQVDEVWTKDSCAVIVRPSNKVVVFENTMGELPYEWGYADPTGVEDPANMGMGVAFPLYYITPWIDTLVGIAAAWALWAPPTVYTTQDPTPGVRSTSETRVETLQLGKMYHLPPGKKMNVLVPPNVGQQLLGMLAFLIDATERGGLPALVSGAGIGTRMPALTFQAALEAATDRLRAPTKSYERVLAATIMKWHRIIGRYDSAVRVNGWEYEVGGDATRRGWATIRPEEARKGRRVEVSLNIDSTQDQIAKGTHAQFMQNAQLWDTEKAMRFAGVENPEEMKNKIAADNVRRMVQPLLAQTVMQGEPDIAQMLAAAAQQELGAGGEAPPPAPAAAEPPPTGRNRQGVPPGRGGGAGARPTQRPRGNRGGAGQQYGRT